MKNLLIAATALSAFAAAAPAAAQYYPGQPAPYGYGYGDGNGYGYNNGGIVQSYLVRADRLRHRVERLDQRDRIGEREARALRGAAADLQGRTRAYARNGLDRRERYDLDQRFANLEQVIASQRGDNRYGNGWGRGQGGGRDWDRDGVRDGRDGWVDRDRDGIDDRREDDRGRYPG